MRTKKSVEAEVAEPVAPAFELQPEVTDEILEATADIFYLTVEGMESHLQIKGTSPSVILAESKNAIQAIVESGGTTRAKPNGHSAGGNGKCVAVTLPYFVDEQGNKLCNRTTVEGERCGEPVAQREGKFGMFWSCKNFKNHAKANGAAK